MHTQNVHSTEYHFIRMRAKMYRQIIFLLRSAFPHHFSTSLTSLIISLCFFRQRFEERGHNRVREQARDREKVIYFSFFFIHFLWLLGSFDEFSSLCDYCLPVYLPLFCGFYWYFFLVDVLLRLLPLFMRITTWKSNNKQNQQSFTANSIFSKYSSLSSCCCRTRKVCNSEYTLCTSLSWNNGLSWTNWVFAYTAIIYAVCCVW